MRTPFFAMGQRAPGVTKWNRAKPYGKDSFHLGRVKHEQQVDSYFATLAEPGGTILKVVGRLRCDDFDELVRTIPGSSETRPASLMRWAKSGGTLVTPKRNY